MFDTSHAKKLYDACGYQVHEMRVARLCDGVPSARENDFFSAHEAVAAQRKMRRARIVGAVLSCIPWVRAIAVCNSLAFGMVHEESDVDLFVVAATGRAWTVRFIVTTLLAALRLRPGEARRDPVCVSFFIDESIQNFDAFKISQDVYFHFWERSLLALFGMHKTFEHGGMMPPPFAVHQNFLMRALQRGGEFALQIIPEQFLQRLQIKLFPDEICAARDKKDTSVMWDATYIKLHTNDRRAELRDTVCPEHS